MLMFSNLSGALSVKTCYSKFLSSSAVFLLVGIVAAGFLVKENESSNGYGTVATMAYVKK
ncbi:MAG: hypothetical protein V7750_07190 [Sneathiella sp.]